MVAGLVASGCVGTKTALLAAGLWEGQGIGSLLNTGRGTALLILSAFMIFIGMVWLVHHVFYTLAIRQLPKLSPTMKPGTGSNLPKVSVIVPARDEERNIGRCLHTLLAQDYPDLEIIVVDDRSKDRTAEMVEELAARDPRLKLLRNRELPTGWTGKNHAIHLALERAGGEYLVFVDADTWYHPRAISEIVSYAMRENADMISLAGGYHHGSFWEKTLQPVIVAFMGLCVRLWKVNDPASSSAFAAGHFIFVKRQAYDRIGGHAAVSGCLLEDFALASLIKQGGMTLRVVHAPWLMRVRMYHGFRETCRGWTRIFQASIGQAPSRAWAGSVEIVIFGFMPWVGLGVGLTGMAMRPDGPGFTLLATCAAFALLCEVSVLMRAFPFSATSRFYILMLLPTGFVVVGMWSMAIYKVCTGRKVSWRGSLYQAETELNGTLNNSESARSGRLSPTTKPVGKAPDRVGMESDA